MNDRYNTDAERTGTSRKSAASAKPKAKAASTVTVVTGAKTAKEKKAAAKERRRQEEQKQRKEEAKFYNPPTQRYKTLRRLWWVCLIGAILFTILSWVLQGKSEDITNTPSVICMVLAYAAIIAALVIDLGPTRKERKRYAEAVKDKDSPEHAAIMEAEKAAKEAEKAQKAEAKAAYDASKSGAAPAAEGGLLAGLKARFSGAAKTAKDAQAEAAEAAEAAEKAEK